MISRLDVVLGDPRSVASMVPTLTLEYLDLKLAEQFVKCKKNQLELRNGCVKCKFKEVGAFKMVSRDTTFIQFIIFFESKGSPASLILFIDRLSSSLRLLIYQKKVRSTENGCVMILRNSLTSSKNRMFIFSYSSPKKREILISFM